MTTQIAVLVNPSAGRGRHHRSVKAALDLFAASGQPMRVLEADSAKAAQAAGRDAVARGARALVAVGGDGTVHAALQAVGGTDTPLGIVPAGTGNDIAACFGLPASAVAAAEVVVNALRANRTRSLDLAKLSTVDGQARWYGGVLAAGFDSIVNERGNRMRWPKGPRRYDIAILLELAKLRPRRYTVSFDGERVELDAVLLAIGNCSAYGGGMRICPDADPADGLLDLIWGEPVSRTTLLRLTPRVYRGTHILHPKLHQRRAARIEIDAPGIVCYADGERIGPLPVRVEAIPAGLKLLC